MAARNIQAAPETSESAARRADDGLRARVAACPWRPRCSAEVPRPLEAYARNLESDARALPCIARGWLDLRQMHSSICLRLATVYGLGGAKARHVSHRHCWRMFARVAARTAFPGHP